MLMYPQSPGTKPNHKPAGNLVRGRRQGGGRREDLTWLTGSSNYPQRAGHPPQSGERRWRGDLDPQHTGLEADTHTPAAASSRIYISHSTSGPKCPVSQPSMSVGGWWLGPVSLQPRRRTRCCFPATNCVLGYRQHTTCTLALAVTVGAFIFYVSTLTLIN